MTSNKTKSSSKKHPLEIFFDYSCPYCMKAHSHLIDLLPDFPHVEPLWHPCESHPQPERYGPHSDLLIRGMFFAIDAGADILAYHSAMYRAALIDRFNVEDACVVAKLAEHLMDANALYTALVSGKYKDKLAAANSYAYDVSGVWVVPAYRMNGLRIDPIEDVGVSKAQLRRFLELA